MPARKCFGIRPSTDALTELNELKKDVSYGEPGGDLLQVDLEELVAELELFIDEVEEAIRAAEEDL